MILKTICSSLIVLLSINLCFALKESNSFFQHPRGIINFDIQQNIHRKIAKEPYKSLLVEFEKRTLDNVKNDNKIIIRSSAYGILKNMTDLAFLYSMTGKQDYADQAYNYIEICTIDTLFWTQPMSFGLTRARFLRNSAITYDLCYNAWNTIQRNQISERLINCAFSLKSTMGFEANYALESNWMGVRYGAVLLAALVADDYQTPKSIRSPLDALIWDTRERLRDHISVNINPNGWSAESLGYHFFAWSFITPAIAAFQNSLRSNPKASLEAFAPHAVNSIKALTSSIVSIKGFNGKGMKADLADDNMGIDPELFLQSFAIYPENQYPLIKWLVDYLKDETLANSLFYRAAYYPDELQSENPE